MKITDLAILFVIIIFPFTLLLDIKVQYAEAAAYKKIEINRKLDTAVEDAVLSMIEGGAGKNVEINKENALREFLYSLYVNFNYLEDSIEAKQLQGYISCIAIVDYDGYYIVSNQEYNVPGGYKEMKLVWSPKQTFSYYYDGYVCMFTLDNILTLVDSSRKEIYTGTPDQIVEKMGEDWCPDFLKDEAFVDQLRRKTIIDRLKMDINYTINKHNDVARMFGISYNFTLPQIKDEDWYKTIDDVGMLVFFQGMPIGVSGERINTYALGGARVVKNAKFVLEEREISPGMALRYYHRQNCSEIAHEMETSDEIRVLDTRSECAANGYMPCPVCNP